MARLTPRQRISAAKTRLEDSALYLISFVEGYSANTGGPLWKRGELLKHAREYAARVDILTRVRK